MSFQTEVNKMEAMANVESVSAPGKGELNKSDLVINGKKNDGNDDDKDGEIILKSTGTKILEGLEKASQERNSHQVYVKSCVDDLKEDIKRVESKAEDLNVVQEDIKKMK